MRSWSKSLKVKYIHWSAVCFYNGRVCGSLHLYIAMYLIGPSFGKIWMANHLFSLFELCHCLHTWCIWWLTISEAKKVTVCGKNSKIKFRFVLNWFPVNYIKIQYNFLFWNKNQLGKTRRRGWASAVIFLSRFPN